MENIEKMSYEEFKRELKKRVQEKADDGVEVKKVILAKKNQTKSENLAYKGDGFNLLPSIRLQEFYQRYQELGMDWCVEAAASVGRPIRRCSSCRNKRDDEKLAYHRDRIVCGRICQSMEGGF